MPRAGTRIGRYELLTLVGRGGVGEVWESILHGPHGFEKRVALKLLRAGPRTEEGREMLVREARIGAMLSHPNVVATLELGFAPLEAGRAAIGESSLDGNPSSETVGLGEDDGRWFVAMELVRGASAGALVSVGPLPPGLVVNLGIQACAGLAHIHALEVDGRPAGLVHRDVKPRNLLLDRSGILKVADLGVAILAGEAGVAGTPGYMAPEQRRGQEGAPADLFALGVSLYNLATGLKPFGLGLKALEKTERVEELLADPAFLQPVDAAVPGLGPVIRRCLRYRQQDRFPTATDLATALARCRTGLPPAPPTEAVLARLMPELAADPSPSVAPTLALAPGVVPRRTDRFVGRSDELDQLLGRIVARPGLTTLLGPGGAGKTRLALEVAHRARSVLPAGAWFCDLAAATVRPELCAEVAGVLGVPRGGDAVARVGEALRGRGAALLVLDNLDATTEAAAELIDAWRAVAPELRVLTTSQVALRIASESVVPLGPLAVDDGVDLFVARSPRPVPDEHRPIVRDLVARLDGLPLAIELAAARMRSLSVPAILERTEDRFRLLSGGGPDRPQRHRSLLASLEASWELLAPHEQMALAQLSVFAGSMAVEAAEAVLELPADSPWALDVLASLVDHSLLWVEPDAVGFRMIGSVRQFAAAHLAPEYAGAVRSRHGRFFAQRGTPSAMGARKRRGAEVLRKQLHRELDDLVVASRRAAARSDGEVAAATALAAWDVVMARGPIPEGAALLEAALDLESTREVSLHEALGSAHRLLGDFDLAREHLQAALQLERQLRGRPSEGTILGQLGLVEQAAGNPSAARSCFDTEIALSRALSDRVEEANALGNRGVLNRSVGRMAEARKDYEDSLALHRAVQNPKVEGVVLGNLGNLHREAGRDDEALECYRDALRLHRAEGSRLFEGVVLGNLGGLYLRQGRKDEARRAFSDALEVHVEVGNVRSEAITLGNLADLEGDLDALEQALVLARRIGARRVEAVFVGVRARLRAAAGAEVDGAELRQAEAMLRDLGDKLELAKLLCVRAEVERDPDALREALVLCEALETPPEAELAQQLRRVAALTRA